MFIIKSKFSFQCLLWLWFRFSDFSHFDRCVFCFLFFSNAFSFPCLSLSDCWWALFQAFCFTSLLKNKTFQLEQFLNTFSIFLCALLFTFLISVFETKDRNARKLTVHWKSIYTWSTKKIQLFCFVFCMASVKQQIWPVEAFFEQWLSSSS